MRFQIYISLLLFLCTACNVQRFVPANEKLFNGSSLRLKSDFKVDGRADLKKELEALLKPKANQKVLGARIKLWAYFKSHTPGTKKFVRKYGEKYGEKPVYYSQVDTARTKSLIQNRLENRGYYASKITAEVHLHKNTAGVHYKVDLSQPYRLQTYSYLGDTFDLSKKIIKVKTRRKKIKPGWRYDLDDLKKEREKIADYLKTVGYYEFRGDYLVFKIDTNQSGLHLFNLYLMVKEDTPKDGLACYKINSVKVYSDYGVLSDRQKIDTTQTVADSIFFVEGEKKFKPKYLSKYIQIRPGHLYNQRLTDITTSRLAAIGTFQYINIRYRYADSLQKDTAKYRLLDADIYLSTYKSQAVRFEIQGLSKSNNFIGPQLLGNYKNRSIFNAGELLSITGKFGFESQFVGGRQTGLYAITFGAQADLIFPRLVVPFTINVKNTYSVPKTKFSVSYDIMNRIQYYKLNSALFSYGHKWNSSQLVSHEYNPISVNFVKTSNTSDVFEKILQDNPYLRTSFQQQFILGMNYTLLYNELLKKPLKRNSIYFQFDADLSGTAIHAIQTAGGRKNAEGPEKVLGEPYAQYAKFDYDVRLYKKIKKQSQIIFRLYNGIGYAYGNSTQLPYIKMFFSGGPNSVRAFRVRSIGPGSYVPTGDAAQNYWDQMGDIKIEANVEYRFPIYSIIKGAWFIDAGNVWLVKDNPALPGGKFTTSSFYKEIAMGGGFGLRADIKFFVIRFDLASPMRTPSLTESERWTGIFDLKNTSNLYRSLVLNFAIGYPF